VSEGVLAYVSGSSVEQLRITNTGHVQPGSNDGGQLGVSGTAWSDLFLASGGVINFNAGDVTITHSSNTLAFAGASTAYTFADGPVRPATNDGAALGVSGTAWSDLFLANGGVINFNAGDVTITHSAANTLTFAGASSGYVFNDGTLAWGGGSAISSSSNVALTNSVQTWANTSGNGWIQSAASWILMIDSDSTSSGEGFYFRKDASGSGGTDLFSILENGNVSINATAKLALDGGGDTYIAESNANEVSIFVGGTRQLRLDTGSLLVPNVYNDTVGDAVNVTVASDGRIRRSTSSLRYKHDIASLDTADALTAVMAMRPITYRGKTDEDQRRYVGFVAEEMATIAPLLATYDEGGESGTPNYVTYDRVTAYLVAVVQQQQAEINALKAQLTRKQ